MNASIVATGAGHVGCDKSAPHEYREHLKIDNNLRGGGCNLGGRATWVAAWVVATTTTTRSKNVLSVDAPDGAGDVE